MKKSNKKLTTLILAGALGLSAVLGVATLDNKSVSAHEAQKYSLTNIFSASTATIAAEKLEGDETKTAKFTIKDSGSVSIKRNLAYKWFVGAGEARYLTMTYAFGNLDFKTVDFVIESESSLTEEDSENIVRFVKNDEGKILVFVVEDGASEDEIKEAQTNAIELTIAANEEFTIALTEEKKDVNDEDYKYDQFGVKVNDKVIGKFTHVGANYATNPLTIKASGAEAVVYLSDISGQKFDNIVTEGEGTAAMEMVADTAAPVIVANETLNALLFGAKFDFSYTAVDVLETSSNVTEVDKYYQYNPNDTKAEYSDVGSSRYFMDTVYEKDGVKTSVYKEYKNEYVSIQITAKDKTFTGAENDADHAAAVIDLAWYAEDGATQTWKVGEKDVLFIKVNESKQGASYIDYTEAQVIAYNTALAKEAAEVYAGTGSTMDLPSLDGFIEDDNGYKGLKFTICYKTESANNLTKGPVAYNSLEIPTTTVGKYQFKVFATDKAGNAMQATFDGKTVDVTSSNIWDIEEIPVFEFEVMNKGLRVEESKSADEDDRTETKVLDQTYSLSGITVVGGSNQKSEFALYKVDMEAYNSKISGTAKQLTSDMLASIAYEDIRTEMMKTLHEVKDGKYMELHLATYKQLLAKKLGADVKATDLDACFTKVEAYDSSISQDDKAAWDASDNKYEWQKSGTSSFKTAEEGEYLIFGDYRDDLLPTTSRAVAYKLIVVESKVDTIKGETEWLKNNLVSVILFSIAAVMLVLIIILLLIKPSDETLEDVDKEVSKKNAKKSK